MIPESAFRTEDQILILEEDNRLHTQKVSVLFRTGKEVWVEDGLKDGDRVCVTPLEIVAEGMQVRIEARKHQRAIKPRHDCMVRKEWGCGQPPTGNHCNCRSIFSIKGMKMELFPDFDLDLVSITVPYPGAAPLEVEDGICKQIEEKIWDLSGIKELVSYSQENEGVVGVQVERGNDPQELADKIKVRVDSILNFPEEAEKPIVEVATQRRRVLAVAIHGNCDEKSLRKIADKTLDDLTNLKGITQVEIAGIRKPEIGIEVSEASLRQYGLSFDQVAQALKRSSIDTPGGVARTSSGETLLRSMGKAQDGKQFEEIRLLSNANGSNVQAGDLASVKDGFEDKVLYTGFSNEPAVTLLSFESENKAQSKSPKESPITLIQSNRDYPKVFP